MKKRTVSQKIIGAYFKYVKVNHRKPTHVIITTDMRNDGSIEKGYVFEFRIMAGKAFRVVKLCYMIEEEVKTPKCVRIG